MPIIGHLVLCLLAYFVLFYTSRVIFKGHVFMEEMVFSLKHYWTAVDFEPPELYGFHRSLSREAACMLTQSIKRKSHVPSFPHSS